MKKSFLNQFNERVGALTSSEEKVARYIKENPLKVVNMSIQSLANECFVVPSTVIKTAKKLGFSGFSELKIALAAELDKAAITGLDSDILSNTFKRYAEFVQELIEQASVRLSEELLNEAARIVLEANKIDIYSFGFDSIAGLDLYLKLVQIGKTTAHYENGYMQMISATYLGTEDAVIAISSTGSSKDLFDAVKRAIESGAKVIVIAPSSSMLAGLETVYLDTYFSTLVLPEGGIATRLVQLFLIDQLYLRILKMDEKSSERYEKFQNVLEYKRKAPK
ncbi:MurR/RpiR family transcriptional regulator [Kosmotoga olearia]|uniref:Transcriptional regulator, RpiR family n=1 Tax=Kosmotoga olearia (strain ATCC BAA-1733 / DSM 21960 / TBF 19.5.1) TaxID=521045 RepID=C5CD76_KOSOT|nr:MurR/RpiR family transcriptional regulator [Kosmotoga olearia]ACR79020.1 transcriptional regulator, RpiR family [Kosmotoga olearia TBF 19.5.1]